MADKSQNNQPVNVNVNLNQKKGGWIWKIVFLGLIALVATGGVHMYKNDGVLEYRGYKMVATWDGLRWYGPQEAEGAVDKTATTEVPDPARQLAEAEKAIVDAPPEVKADAPPDGAADDVPLEEVPVIMGKTDYGKEFDKAYFPVVQAMVQKLRWLTKSDEDKFGSYTLADIDDLEKRIRVIYNRQYVVSKAHEHFAKHGEIGLTAYVESVKPFASAVAEVVSDFDRARFYAESEKTDA